MSNCLPAIRCRSCGRILTTTTSRGGLVLSGTDGVELLRSTRLRCPCGNEVRCVVGGTHHKSADAEQKK